jgi:hypothetical protein
MAFHRGGEPGGREQEQSSSQPEGRGGKFAPTVPEDPEASIPLRPGHPPPRPTADEFAEQQQVVLLPQAFGKEFQAGGPARQRRGFGGPDQRQCV